MQCRHDVRPGDCAGAKRRRCAADEPLRGPLSRGRPAAGQGSGWPRSSSAALGGMKLGSRSGGAVMKPLLASIQRAAVRALRK